MLNCFFIYLSIYLLISLVSGFLTLPTAYVTGNPVECVVHPDLWNKTKLWDPLVIGRVSVDLEDEYVEENYGTPITTVRCSAIVSY